MLDLSVEDDGGIEEYIREVKENAHALLRDLADEIFTVSQKKVPVDMGTLKKSGNMMMHGDRMAIIGYNTTYALPVHDGIAEQDVQVREHTRRTKSGGSTTVRTHKRHVHARAARKYLDDAIREVLAQYPKETQDMVKIDRYRSDLLGE